MKKRELLKYAGDYSQLFGIKPYTLTDGRANGVRAFDVRNGSGLEFTVLQDRCLDISALSYKGVNYSYMSKTGIVAPSYYEPENNGFLRNFFTGMLTTCGLRNVGPPCDAEGEAFTQHGRIANIAAENVCQSVVWDNGSPVMKISGTMREACFFGENILLHREIVCPYNANKILIHNTVENLSFRREALMLLFHFNIGYPLLSEHTRLVFPEGEVTPRDSDAEAGVAEWSCCQPPTAGYREQVFYHDLQPDISGMITVAVHNDESGFALYISFSKKQFPYFAQWKQMGEGEYVMGLEPCNCYVDGRYAPRNEGVIDYLEPGETRQFDVELEVIRLCD